MEEKKKWLRNTGRKLVADPANRKITIRMNEQEYTRFEGLMDIAEIVDKTQYIKSCIFDKKISVMKINKAEMDYVKRLPEFYGQFRAIGVNYNQVVVALKSNFSERKAMQLLYRLEQETIKLAQLSKQIIELTKEAEGEVAGRIIILFYKVRSSKD